MTTYGNGKTILEVKGLKQYFPIRQGFLQRVVGYVKAVDGVTFTVRENEALGLVGESGCGKTTTGRLILHLYEPSGGEVPYHKPDGSVVNLAELSNKEMKPLRRDLRMIFQDPYSSLNPRLTVRDIIGEPLIIQNEAKGKDVDARVAELMTAVGLDPAYMGRYPHEFSGGQRQRIGLARTLSPNPRLIIADEPVSALDVSVQAQVLNLLAELKETLGLTFIFVAHDLSVVEHFCDRIAVMYVGKLVGGELINHEQRKRRFLMAKITFIGAGSLVFTQQLCNDILLSPALRESTIALMDVDATRLEQARTIVQSMIDHLGIAATVEATTDRRAAVSGADYVVTTFQQGGLDAYRLDIEIPQKYGVEQCVGDTLGPGGVFRSLRTIPVLIALCDEMDDVAPDALLLNYVNPMAANCWAVADYSGRPHVGLCHSVQGTSEMIARWIDVPYEEINFVCAGINHQAFFLQFRRGKQDLFPQIWEAIARPEVHGEEPVRSEIMQHFGYFVTESSGHASEYMPYFRKSAAMVNDDLVPTFTDEANDWLDWGRTGGYLRHCLARLEHFQSDYEEIVAADPAAKRSHEYGSWIIEAMEINQPVKINGNVPNVGLIDNLPTGCCVEVPCLVDASGIQPMPVRNYPTQLAALNRTNINVQSLIVEAALSGKTDAVHHAVLLDPLTAAVCTMDQIHAMVDEMLAAQAQWLPQFHLFQPTI